MTNYDVMCDCVIIRWRVQYMVSRSGWTDDGYVYTNPAFNFRQPEEWKK